MRPQGVLSIALLLGAMVGVVATAPVGTAGAVPLATPPAPLLQTEATPGEGQPAEAQPAQMSVLLAAGDIARCGEPGAAATAALLRDRPGTVATLGDNAYRVGSEQQFAECYDPTWGAEKGRTRPALGNHDYGAREAKGYFDYFGDAAGERGAGYYSYDLGTWHVAVLNSNCGEVGGCETGSPQERWLRADLAAHPAACTLAYWHHPLFSSGKEHGGEPEMGPIWETLGEAGADVVLSGHEHNYERFAPQDANGRADPRRGIRQFVVGTGGTGHYLFGEPLATSEARNADTFGVLALTLRPTGYDWEFVPAADAPVQADGDVFHDAGSGDCH